MKRKTLVAICMAMMSAYAGATSEQSSDAKAVLVGPKLTNQKVSACLTSQAVSDSCATVALPTAYGQVSTILKTSEVRNSDAAWIALTEKEYLFCGLKISTSKLTCAPIVGLKNAMIGAPVEATRRIVDVIAESRPALGLAAKRVSAVLGGESGPGRGITALDSEDGDHTPNMPEDMTPSPGDPGGSGEIPIVEVPGTPETGAPPPEPTNPDAIGPETPAGPGPVVEPPGSVPDESTERAACMASAYAAWWFEDAVCNTIKNPTIRAKCKTYNMGEYNTSRAMCLEIP